MKATGLLIRSCVTAVNDLLFASGTLLPKKKASAVH